MRSPLDTVITVPRRALSSEHLHSLSAAAADRAGADNPVHLARYPAFGHRLRTADIQARSVPALARDLLHYTKQTLIPSAIDRELRLAILQEFDWEERGPSSISAAAAADQEAFCKLGSRILGMAAWQDLDLSTAGAPINCFAVPQAKHWQVLDALHWVPPERLLPTVRQAVADKPDILEFVLGPAVDGLVVWECEELIHMGLELLTELNEHQSIVGIYLKDAAMRRPYTETHALGPVLAAEGVECVEYSDLGLDSAVVEKDSAPSAADDAQSWQQASDLAEDLI